MRRQLFGAATALAGAAALRRLSQRSGATDDEVYASMPGDEVLRHPMMEWNRAVTIGAPPSAVFPWLAQMGYGRAGYYTPEALDRWANRWVWRHEAQFPYRPSPWSLVDDVEPMRVGDIIADGPEFRAHYRVASVVPDEHIVLWSIRSLGRGHPLDPTDPVAVKQREEQTRASGRYVEFSWAFVVRQLDDGRARLLIRSRNVIAPTDQRLLTLPLGLVDAYEGMGMCRNIKARVESSLS